MLSVYDFRDYKAYLNERSVEKGLRSGFKSGLALACGCNSAYISSIVGSKANLSLEQAERVCSFLGFGKDESHFFMLLVQRARAGTAPLSSYFDDQIENMLEQKLNIQKRLGAKERLSKDDQARYYSSWIYAAVHVALAVPRLAKSPDTMAEYLEVPVATVNRTLEFLEGCGLAVRQGSGFAIGPRHIHLSKGSENIQKHHGNWRMRAMRSFEADSEQNLNYSSAVALSREDAFKVKEILLSAIKNSIDVIMKSPEEEVYALTFDFIHLGKS